MKRIYTFILTILVLNSFGQIPAGYYDSANGKTGSELKTALYNIIKDHTVLDYGDLWTAYYNTDVDTYYENDGSVLDIYSENPSGSDPYNFVFGDDQDNGTSVPEGERYNREHSFPKSWFGGEVSPMYTDIFHIYPTDKVVNNERGNSPYGEVTSPTWTSGNGSKLGACSTAGYSGTAFEPIDEFKGDIARTYFYMATRYENLIATWETNSTESNVVLNGTSYPCYEQWFLDLLLDWHTNDPVSQKEIDRNNEIYDNYQHNRNPYIDHPEYVAAVFDPGSTGIIDANKTLDISIYPNPVISLLNVEMPINYSAEIYSVIGEKIITASNEKINTGDWKPGIYFVLIKNELGVAIKSEKIIKK